VRYNLIKGSTDKLSTEPPSSILIRNYIGKVVCESHWPDIRKEEEFMPYDYECISCGNHKIVHLECRSCNRGYFEESEVIFPTSIGVYRVTDLNSDCPLITGPLNCKTCNKNMYTIKPQPCEVCID